MNVYLKNDVGMMKECKTGKNWLCFFFGGFVPLIEGDIKTAGIYFGVIIFGFITLGCWDFLIMIGMSIFLLLKYNEMRIKNYLEKGYKPVDENVREYLVKQGILYE